MAKSPVDPKDPLAALEVFPPAAFQDRKKARVAARSPTFVPPARSGVMTAEQCAALRAAGPHLYAGTEPSPFTENGFQTPAGWYAIVLDATAKIERVITAMPKGERALYHATQVKEKLGGLRIYLSRTTDALSEIVRDADAKASVACEVCGRPGARRTLRMQTFVACAVHMGIP